MRRCDWFDVWWTCLLLGLTGCDWCEHTPLRPDKCFASTFDYQATPYPYELNGAIDTACGDPEYERNEDMTQAVALRARECNGSRTAHIDGPDDVDVFRTGACEGSIYTNLPGPVTTSADVKGDPNLRFCIFPLCADGATNLQSCTGDEDIRRDPNSGEEVSIVWDAKLNSGFIGCCRVGQGSLEAAYFCPGRTRKVDTYFWVDAGELPLADTCSEYSFTFSVNAD